MEVAQEASQRGDEELRSVRLKRRDWCTMNWLRSRTVSVSSVTVLLRESTGVLPVLPEYATKDSIQRPSDSETDEVVPDSG